MTEPRTEPKSSPASPHNNAKQVSTQPFLTFQLSNPARMGGVTRQGTPSSPTAGVWGEFPTDLPLAS